MVSWPLHILNVACSSCVVSAERKYQLRTVERLKNSQEEKPFSTTCPDCGNTVSIVYGNGWDYDFIFCSCGFEKVSETSTMFDYSE